MSRPGTTGSGGPLGSRPGTTGSGRPGTVTTLGELEAQLKGENALLVQRLARRFIARCRIHKLINVRFEKIWDPRRAQFYYYDKVSNTSRWGRPRLLGEYDIKTVAPTYTRDEAVTMIQRQLLRRVALRRVRMLYQATIVATFDEGSGSQYYHNPGSGFTSWDLPKFMASRLDYEYDKLPPTVRWGADGIIVPEDESDDDSDVSVESAIVRQRRKMKRKFPRSKAQMLVDSVEDNFIALKSLNLSGLGASRITSRVFEMTNLTSLVLSNNQLGPSLNPNIQYLIKLYSLDISGNNFERIPKTLQELIVLREFRASHNLLSTFSGYLYKLSTIQLLDLSHNLFRDLPVESGNLELFKATRQWDVGIQCLKALAVLKLSHNLIETWPEQVDKCLRLKEIDLSFNLLTAVPMLVGANTSLTRLDLSFNRITTLPPEIFKIPLQKLSLNNNFLDDLPHVDDVSSMHLHDLQEFDISYNKLTKLDDRLGIFTGLKRFCANDNLIESVDERIGAMTQATYLNLARNQIQSLPVGFGGCKNLVQLELQCNKISVIPLCMSTMKNLAHLKMNDNQIAEATTQVFGMTSNMQTIDLHNNKIPRLPVTWYTMLKLTSMDVSYNRIEGPIPRGLGGLKDLVTLFMRDNLITELPESISNLTKLRILELENNKIAPSLPIGVSCLKNLWRVTTRNNCFEHAPVGLFHLPLLTSWDLSWNQRIVGQYIDWQDRERKYSAATDLMPMKMIRRLLVRGRSSLESQKKPTKMDYISNLGPNTTTTEPTNKVSKKEKKEAKRARKQALSEIMSWHNSLKAHFKSHLTIYRPASKVSSSMARRHDLPVGSARNAVSASLSKVASSTFLANQQRRVRTQFLSLFRTLRLTSAVTARDPGDVADFNNSPVPDADIVEALDLGWRFQEAIDMFEAAARNICHTATLRYAQNAQARAITLQEAARKRKNERDSMAKRALFAVDEPPPEGEEAADEKALPGKEAAQAPLLSARSMPPLSARSNTSEGKQLLQLALGSDSKPSQIQQGEDDEDIEVDDTDYGAMPKSSFVNISAPPFLQQYPILDGLTDTELHGFAFDAYLGMGSALLKRADCIALAIRDVERRGKLPISLLNVAQRLEDDFEDLAADDYEDMMEKMTEAEKSKGSSLVEKKKARMAALMAKSGLADKEIDIDEVDEESAKAKKEAKKKAEIEQLEKKRLQNRVDLDKKKKADEEEAKQAADQARRLEEEGGAAEDDEGVAAAAAAAAAEDPNVIHENNAKVIAEFLFEHRKLTLVWAKRALDAAAELLKMRGWDALCPTFALNRASVIDRGSERLLHDAMDLHLSRGRVLQLTDQYKAALQEYQSCVTISNGKFFRDAAIECIKVQLADTQYAAAHKSLVEFITNEVPDADRRFPEIHELIKSDRRLAMLLMLANAGIDQMRNAGVWAPSLTIAYEVQDNGLVVKPPPIRESELHLKRNPKDYTIIADRLAKVESENAEWAKNQSLIELKDKVHACLHKYQAILEASTAEMARIEEELKEKAAAAEKAKNMPAIPRGGGGGRGGAGAAVGGGRAGGPGGAGGRGGRGSGQSAGGGAASGSNGRKGPAQTSPALRQASPGKGRSTSPSSTQQRKK